MIMVMTDPLRIAEMSYLAYFILFLLLLRIASLPPEKSQLLLLLLFIYLFNVDKIVKIV